MRTSLLVLVLGFAAGCTDPATVTGTPCKTAKDCNITGQICVAGLRGGPSICTHTCTSNIGDTGCPPGFDCTISDTNVGRTCNLPLYSTDPDSGAPLLFGKSCALDDNACQDTGDPNPMPVCRKGLDQSKDTPTPLSKDPGAYCTGACTDDLDCPLSYGCNTDYDGVKKCLKRNVCDECSFNDDCPTEFPVCITGKDGKNYCTKTCVDDGSCPGAPAGTDWMVCDRANDWSGTEGRFCVHSYGSCVGDGEICAPCRTKDDCKTGLGCYHNDATLEGFCTMRCSDDAQCVSPHPTGCDNIMPTTVRDPIPSLLCTGDPQNLPYRTGIRSCWLL